MATIGFAYRRYSFIERIILICSAILLIMPGLNSDGMGIALFIMILVYRKFYGAIKHLKNLK